MAAESYSTSIRVGSLDLPKIPSVQISGYIGGLRGEGHSSLVNAKPPLFFFSFFFFSPSKFA